MKNNIKLELEGYSQFTSKGIKKIINDLDKIDGFELHNVKPWKSNLPTLLPTIGSKMESEIKLTIDGMEVTYTDQKLRSNYNSLSKYSQKEK